MLIRVSALLFCSGFCALVYQMVWLRMFRLVFGASHASTAAVLAIFMGGLGLGGLLLGKRADDSDRPLRLYGRLELGIALAAALSPLLLAGVREVYLGMGGALAVGTVPGTVLRLGLSALVLAVPTLLMGGTLPAAVRAVERGEDVGRRELGVVYGANTAGAVTGACVAVFFALEALGAQGTLLVAAALNLVVALVAIRIQEPPRTESPEHAAAETDSSEVAASMPPGLVLAAAGAVGFAFLLMEMVWSRMLSPILGGSTYTFGLVLAVALAGIGGGGLLYGSGKRTIAATPKAFALTCALEAVFIALPLALGDRVALLAAFLRPIGETGFGPLVATWFIIVVLVVLPASFVAGYQFPLLVALLGKGDEKVGRQVGLAYASNTMGSILGSLAGGFGLLPLLGAVSTWRLVVVGLAGLSVVPLLRGIRSARVLAVGLVATVAVGLASSEGPTAVWRHSPIGAGRFKPDVESRVALEDQLRARRRAIVWEVDGVESTVALDARYGYAFVVNGKSDGHVIGDAPTFVMHGLLGTMLHPNPKSAMVVGLGTGETAGWLARVDGMEQIDVVELEPAIAEVARLCAPVNYDVMNEPMVTLFPGDGREFLLTTSERYDVIVNEPSNPYRAGIASLFTLEFYEAVSERLTDDGLFVQWVQAYDLSASTIRTILATLGTVFPHVEVFESQTAGDLLLVASLNPVKHNIEQIRARAQVHPYRESLSWMWGVAGVEGFYSTYVANQSLTRAIVEAEGGRINTDDRPFIEYEFARGVGLASNFSVSELSRLAAVRGEDRPLDLPADA
ncbi:MAG TPA: spermidine synthase, partial [Deltaproteobacteria bacterium]|nr:spermidine synthase [Deltaproteobacteria bacterium]